MPRGTVQDVILTQDARQHRQDRRASTTIPAPIRRCSPARWTRSRRPGLTGDNFYAQHPEANIERKFTLLQQPNGITMRKDQFNLHQWVNTFVYFVKNNGELDAIYQKWFHKPLPNLPVF